MKKYNSYKFLFISALIFFLLAFGCLYLYLDSQKILKDAKKAQVYAAGNIAARDFIRIINENIISLQNLKERIEESKGGQFKYLESETARIKSQNESIQFIEWIDSNGIIRVVIPEEENEEVLNLDIKKLDYRYPDWLENSQDTLLNLSQWLKLTQNKMMFLVDLPMYYDDKFQGTITAGMDFKNEFDKLSAKLENYSIQIQDERGTTFYEFNNAQNSNLDEKLELKIPLYIEVRNDKPWLFHFKLVNDKFLNRNTPQIAFAVGIILSSLISLLVFYYLTAKRETRRYETGNLELQKINKELALQKEMANKASDAKTLFLANMSHEIRTPLSAILGFVDILEGQNLSPSDKEYVNLMRYSSDTLLNLVNNILEFDKIESGTMFLSKDRFKPKDLVENLIKTNTDRIVSKGLTIESDFTDTPAYTVSGDRIKTEQIFINILNNSIKFTDKGTIGISYSETVNEDYLQLEYIIEDTGIGIPEDKLDEIFDRFIQVDNSLRKRHIGSGLGLAITKELVKLLNGDIRVSSEVGKGTKFQVLLSFPLVSPTLDEALINFEELDFSHLKVLIVDDNKLNRMILRKVLNKVGINAETAEGGQEALELTSNTHYDLIFMDVHMPGIDGFEIVKRIRKDNKESVILGLSADVTYNAIEEGIRSGMNDYLTKPIEQAKLFYILNNYFMPKIY